MLTFDCFLFLWLSRQVIVLGLTYGCYLRRRISLHRDILRRVDVQLVRMFFAGAIPGSLVAIVVESIVTVILAVLVFWGQYKKLIKQVSDGGTGGEATGENNNDENGDASDTGEIEIGLRLILFLLAIAYIVAGLTEETVKLLMLRYRFCRTRGVNPEDFSRGRQRNTDTDTTPADDIEAQTAGAQQRSTDGQDHSYVPESMNFYSTRRGDLAGEDRGLCLQSKPYHPYITMALMLSVAAGFSTMENLFYVFSADMAGTQQSSLKVPGFSDKMFNSLGRVFLSLPVHMICGAITAILLCERDRQEEQNAHQPPDRTRKPMAYLKVLMPSVLFHGTFDAGLMIAAAIGQGNLAVVLSFAIFMGILGIVIVYFLWKRSAALTTASLDYQLYSSLLPSQSSSGNGSREVEMRQM